MRPLLAVLAAVVGVAGCSDAPPPAAPEAPQVTGWVFDPNRMPLPDAEVRVLDRGIANATSLDGRYALDGLPVEEPVVLVASRDGHEPRSKQVTLPAEGTIILNFTLAPVPVKEPRHEVQDFQGQLNCQALVVSGDDEFPIDCSGGEGQRDTWDLAADADLAGAVFEVVWSANNDAARSFGARVETLGFGDANEVLAEAVSESPLRLQVAAAKAEKFYAAGGAMRVTVWVEPHVADEETNSGLGLAVNQGFEVLGTLFYVEPPEPTYSAIP